MLPTEEIDAFLDSLSDNALLSLPYLFEHWAHREHQLPPAGNWRQWVILGGRGAGKTRAGAEWVRAQVEGATPLAKGKCHRIALVAETIDQGREVMILGDSGILACSPPDRRPEWKATRKALIWPNGAEAQLFSAFDAESLRGPQFDGAWVDELAKWKNAEEAWMQLQFALRLGDDPRAVVTTTPRRLRFLNELLEDKATVVTKAPTQVNRANLANGFIETILGKYGGSQIGRQEIEGELLTEDADALWPLEIIDRQRAERPKSFDRIVVSVDPPVTKGEKADSCGIIVAGACYDGAPQNWKAYILGDFTLQGHSPNEWVQYAVKLYEDFGADKIVAEVNQGGDLIETLIRQVSPFVPYKAVRAIIGKTGRAEPAAALYEQGRVFHCACFEHLERQMSMMSRSGFQGRGSPDRVDALVWALYELMLNPAERYREPRIRLL